MWFVAWERWNKSYVRLQHNIESEKGREKERKREQERDKAPFRYESQTWAMFVPNALWKPISVFIAFQWLSEWKRETTKVTNMPPHRMMVSCGMKYVAFQWSHNNYTASLIDHWEFCRLYHFHTMKSPYWMECIKLSRMCVQKCLFKLEQFAQMDSIQKLFSN